MRPWCHPQHNVTLHAVRPQVKFIFKCFDKNNDGFLSRDEIKAMLVVLTPRKELAKSRGALDAVTKKVRGCHLAAMLLCCVVSLHWCRIPAKRVSDCHVVMIVIMLCIYIEVSYQPEGRMLMLC